MFSANIILLFALVSIFVESFAQYDQNGNPQQSPSRYLQPISSFSQQENMVRITSVPPNQHPMIKPVIELTKLAYSKLYALSEQVKQKTDKKPNGKTADEKDRNLLSKAEQLGLDEQRKIQTELVQKLIKQAESQEGKAPRVSSGENKSDNESKYNTSESRES